MLTLNFPDILLWVLILFLLSGAIVNCIPIKAVRDGFEAWGYPSWLPRFTALLQFIAAILLIWPAGRLAGATLSALVMVAAIFTKIRFKEAFGAMPAIVALMASCAVAYGRF